MDLRVAVWGTGSIGSRHLRVLRSIPNVVPIAVPTRPERVAHWQSSGFEAHSTIAEASADAVVLATDTGRHALDLSQLGDLPVLAEKPLFSDYSDDLVQQYAGRPGLFVGCCLRFHPAVAAFAEAMPSRESLLSAHITCETDLAAWRPDRPYQEAYSGQSGQGGSLRELIHEVDLAGWLFGWPEAVVGNTEHHWRLDIPDETGAVYADHPATTVRVKLDLASETTSRSIHATWKDKCSLILDIVKGIVHRTVGANLQTLFDRPVDRDEMYVRQAEAFVAFLRGGDPGPLATSQEGLRALAVVEAVRSSAATGRPTPVPWPDHSTPSSP